MRPERRRMEEVRRQRTVATEPVPGTSSHPKVQVLAGLMREWQKGLQLSANGAAELSGLVRGTVGNFERGEVSALLDSFFLATPMTHPEAETLRQAFNALVLALRR